MAILRTMCAIGFGLLRYHNHRVESLGTPTRFEDTTVRTKIVNTKQKQNIEF